MIKRIHKRQYERACMKCQRNANGNDEWKKFLSSGKIISNESDSNGQHLSDAAEHHNKGGHDAKKHNRQGCVHTQPFVRGIDHGADRYC